MAAGQKIYDDPEIGLYTVRKSSRASQVSIRVHPVKGVEVVLPSYAPYLAGVSFFKLKKAWVKETLLRFQSAPKITQRAAPEEVERLRLQAREELPSRLAVLAHRYGFIYRRVAIKHNSSNWGSCSSLGNINLNLNLVRLPRVLSDYVLIHELCHLRHHDHGEEFHLLLERLCGDNLARLVEEGDAEAVRIAALVRRSRAKHPVHFVMTREIRKYRPV